MFSITEAAGAHLAEMLKNAEEADDVFLRLVEEKDGFALRHDSAVARDKTFTHEGRTVLLLDEELCQKLTDRTLDVDDTEECPRLRLRRPPL